MSSELETYIDALIKMIGDQSSPALSPHLMTSFSSPPRVIAPSSQSPNRQSFFSCPRPAPHTPGSPIKQDLEDRLTRPPSNVFQYWQHFEVFFEHAANNSKLISEYRACHNALSNSIDRVDDRNKTLHDVKVLIETMRRAETEVSRKWRRFDMERKSLGVDVNQVLKHMNGAKYMLRRSGNPIRRRLERLGLMNTKRF